MVNYNNTIKSIGIFLAGVIFLVISENFFDPLLEIINGFGGFAIGIATFGEVMILIASILIGLIAPIFFGINAINEDNNYSKTQNIGIGLMVLVFGLLFSVAGWYVVPNVVSIISSTIFQGIFWVGLLSTWIINVLVVPINVFVSYR